jgi:TonB family protein
MQHDGCNDLRVSDGTGGNIHSTVLEIRTPKRVVDFVRAWATLVFVAAAAGAQDLGTITGTVADSAGAPLLGAELSVDSVQVRAYTDSEGGFRLSGIPFGMRTLSVRRLGFAPTRIDVQVSQGGAASVAIRLTPVASTLPPVVIKPTHMDYTRDQIDHEAPRLLGQLLQHVPGVTAVRARGGITGIRLRGRTCWPLVWIDGTPMPSGEVDLDSFSPTSIHGIELYLGSTTAPARYMYTRDVSSCGTILIWSRGPDTDPITTTPKPSVDLQSLVTSLKVFNAAQVDRRATLDTTRLMQLSFPPPLFAAGVPGLVIAEFVVDTAGRVEDGTVGIVSSTAPLFTEAVRVALESAAYIPAIKNGRPVRQLVQQPFEFSVNRQARAR